MTKRKGNLARLLALLLTAALGAGLCGTALAALVTGEPFTINVVAVYKNGTVIDNETLSTTCKDRTGHSGYNHSIYLKEFHPSVFGWPTAGWAGWCKPQSTVYTGQSLFNTFTAYSGTSTQIHYNIQGSTPYKAVETIFLVYDNPTYSYTVTHVYRTDGAEDGRVTSTVSGVASGATVYASSIPKKLTYNGNTYAFTSATPTSAKIAGNGTRFTLYYDRETRITRDDDKIVKVFQNLPADKVPVGFSLDYTISSGAGGSGTVYQTGTLTPAASDAATVSGSPAYSMDIPSFMLPAGTAQWYVTIREHNADVSGYTYTLENASKQITYSSLGNALYYYNTYAPKAPAPVWEGLTVEKTADRAAVKPGDMVVYTIRVANGTGKALQSILVSERLNANLTFVSAAPEGQYDPDTGVWAIPALADGEAAALTLKATVNSGVADGTVIANAAVVTGAKDEDDNGLPADTAPGAEVSVTVVIPDPDPTSSPSTSPISSPDPTPSPSTSPTSSPTSTPSPSPTSTPSISPNLSPSPSLNPTPTPDPNPAPTADWAALTLEKTADKTAAKPGDAVTYSVKVTNNTGKALTNVTVSEKLDANLTFVSASGAGSYDANTGMWTIPSLNNGASAALTLNATLAMGVANQTKIQNVAFITDATADGGERQPENRRPGDSAVITVTGGSGPDAPASNVPKTGDANGVELWFALMLLALCGLAAAALYSRKRGAR